jgi:hypothetical protein
MHTSGLVRSHAFSLATTTVLMMVAFGVAPAATREICSWECKPNGDLCFNEEQPNCSCPPGTTKAAGDATGHNMHEIDNGEQLDIFTCHGTPTALPPPRPTTLFREVDCDHIFPGETGLGLYLKGRFRATCTIERSYHDNDDATKEVTIRVMACARSDSAMEAPSLARMRARDYAFSLALQSLPRPEMDSGGDRDIGCGE